MADIAAAADIAPRTFFAYFPSKEAVVFHDFDALFESLRTRSRTRPDGETAIDALRRWLEHAMPAKHEESEDAVLRKRMCIDEPALAAHQQHLLSRLEEILRVGVARDLGEPPTGCARSSSPPRPWPRWRDRRRARRQGASRWRCSTRRWSSCAAASPRCRALQARPRRSRAPAPRRSPACFQLLEVRRLLDHLEVDHALAEAVEPVGADDRVQRHARLAGAGADLAHELALQRLLVELALAGDDGARRAHALVEVERVEHERRAGLERRAVLRPQAAAQAARAAGHRHAARVLRELAARARPAAPRAARSSPRRRPSAAPKTFGASSNGVRTSHSTTIFARPMPPAASIASIAPGAAVGRGRAADGDEDHRGARLRGGGDQLAGAVGARRSRRPRLRHQPEAAGHRHLDDRRPAVLDQAEAGACTRRAERAR